jgi:nitrate/nitrite-specific signal transduction histidine kinase
MRNNIFFFKSLLLACSFITISLPIDAGELTYAEAINKAGRQRMLTQRITKSYCQIGLDVYPERSKQQLEDGIALFTAQLQKLIQFSSDQEIATALERVESQWNTFRNLARSTPSQANVRRLTEMDEELLRASEHVVRLLEDRSGIPTSRYVNISGRQRMLSQRLAKYYMLQSWNQGTPSMNSEIERAMSEFRGALDTLAQADENTIAINAKLDDARVQWMWLNSSLKFSQAEYFPLIVFDTSEKMLQIMERVTEMYQKVAEYY